MQLYWSESSGRRKPTWRPCVSLITLHHWGPVWISIPVQEVRLWDDTGHSCKSLPGSTRLHGGHITENSNIQWKLPSSGIYRRVVRIWADVSEERIRILPSHLLSLVSRWTDFRPWRWRWHVTPKRRLIYGLHGAISQKVCNFHNYGCENLKSFIIIFGVLVFTAVASRRVWSNETAVDLDPSCSMKCWLWSLSNRGRGR
jgi:hypothetical protein